jgi:hypothetical protein
VVRLRNPRQSPATGLPFLRDGVEKESGAEMMPFAAWIIMWGEDEDCDTIDYFGGI